MKAKMIFVPGIIIGILFILFDMIFAIALNPIFSSYSNLPIWKVPPNISAGVIFDLINGLILVAVYAIIYNGLPGSGLRKGLHYGVIVGLFRVVMASFSSLVMYDIPMVIVIANLIAGYLEIVILCLILTTIFEKLVTLKPILNRNS